MNNEQEQTIVATYKIPMNKEQREDFILQLIGCTIYEPQGDEWIELPMPPYPPAGEKRREGTAVATQEGVWTLQGMERVSPLEAWITNLQMKARLWPQRHIDQGTLPVNMREITAIEIACKIVGVSLHVTAICHMSEFRSYFEEMLRAATEGWNADASMQIDGNVQNVEGFRQLYNEFIMSLKNQYEQIGNKNFALSLRVGLVLQKVPTRQGFAGVTVELRRMDGERGQFVLQCENEELRPHFEQFWQEYQRRWGKDGYIPVKEESDERDTLNEEFVVFDTPTNFVGWLNSFGEAHQPDFKPSGKPAKFLGPSKVMAIHHKVTVGPGYMAGFIGIDILPVDAERLEVSATIFSQMDIIGRLTPGVENPHRNKLDSYFAELIQAIKRRWPQQGKRIEEAKSTYRPFGWPKKGILKCNQWLGQQYFKNGRTNLKDLEDEWVRIRQEQDRAEDVQNNIANMRAFINEEKKRKGYS